MQRNVTVLGPIWGVTCESIPEKNGVNWNIWSLMFGCCGRLRFVGGHRSVTKYSVFTVVFMTAFWLFVAVTRGAMKAPVLAPWAWTEVRPMPEKVLVVER